MTHHVQPSSGFVLRTTVETILIRVSAGVLLCLVSITPAAADSLDVIETKLRPEPISEAAMDDHFGRDVAIDGEWMAIGVPEAREVAWRQGAVDMYRLRPEGTWQREVAIIASDAQERDCFGENLALGDDTLVVAVIRDDHAHDQELLLFYVFEHTDQGWVQNAVLGPYQYDWVSVRLAASGDWFAAGIRGTAPETPDEYEGVVHVYHRDADGWQLETCLTVEDPEEAEVFGWDVDLQADRLVVSSPYAKREPDSREGIVYVLEPIDGSWQETARIERPPGAEDSGWFGRAVALDGDVVAVAHSTSNDHNGAAHLFEYASEQWEHVSTVWPEPGDTWEFYSNFALSGQWLFLNAQIDTPEGPNAVFVYARGETGWISQIRLDLPPDDESRLGTALDADGSYLCTGIPWIDGPSSIEQGAVYIYREDDSEWAQNALLQRGDAILSDGDKFGRNVAVQGDLLLVGSPTDCGAAGAYQGSVYLYRWIESQWQLSLKLLAPDAQAADSFGSSVAISGDRFVVGAGWADTPTAERAGAAYVYRLEGDDPTFEARLSADEGAFGDRFGGAIAMDGDRVVVGARYAEQADLESAGAAYVFARTGGQWEQQARLVASDSVEEAYFGFSVGISGTRAVVGAYHANEYRGAAYVYLETAEGWVEEVRLVEDDSGSGIWFGLAVGIEGDTIAVGAPLVNNPGSSAGRVFVYSRDADVWERSAVLRPDNPMSPARFGGKLALRGGRMAIGAGSESDGDMWNHGAAYLFHDVEGEWSQAARLVASDTHYVQYFGQDAVAVDGAHVVVGVPYDGNGSGVFYGAMYDFEVLCPGDVDGNWAVDHADLMTLLTSYGLLSGARRADGDLDGDADVDLADLATLLAAYGNSCP